MANDREFIIQSLITEEKVVRLADIDPTSVYLQVGVYQEPQRKSGSSNNAYPSRAISIAELLSGIVPPVPIDYCVTPLKAGYINSCSDELRIAVDEDNGFGGTATYISNDGVAFQQCNIYMTENYFGYNNYMGMVSTDVAGSNIVFMGLLNPGTGTYTAYYDARSAYAEMGYGLNRIRLDNASLGLYTNATQHLVVTNAGKMRIPTVQVGNAGLVSGDVYFDTAATALANGDRILIRKT